MNKVFLTGMIANAPTLRMESGEVPHLIFSLSVRHKTRSGELRKEYYRISAWNNSARWGSEHLTRGQVISVQGYLSQRKIQQEQETLFIPEVVAEEFLPMRQVQMAVIASDEADDGACTDSAAV
jgi:single-stranded DNA-binding protein